jgi:uncharacterized membrane protein
VQQQGLVTGHDPNSGQDCLTNKSTPRLMRSCVCCSCSADDRLRLGALVAVLVVANAGLALADVQRTASAAVAVFIFNLLYEASQTLFECFWVVNVWPTLLYRLNRHPPSPWLGAVLLT